MATAVGVAATRGGTLPVFQPGKHQSAEADIYITYLPVTMRRGGHMVVAPTDAGKYPVILFLHGFDINNKGYTNLLKHVASHGFIVVAPKLYAMTFTMDDCNDIVNTKKITNWLADPESGLLHALTKNPKFPGVEPDLTKLALAGHSRGGHTTFATALGLGPSSELKLNFSALIGVDPVAGISDQMPPEVLSKKPGSFNLNGVPVLIVGMGISPQSCAPDGLNHREFYVECRPPRYHFVVTKYGHVDMLDDGITYRIGKCICESNDKDPKELARTTIGGLVVAFLRAKLQGNHEDLKAILHNPCLAPAELDPVECDPA
ncbi:unnamed protein product [Urochloa decumbens]|uniref:Chlorophyllase n=1 Tax=Urochloa decumbens TaxID=240449 RepID=A0ABC9DB83_9POAL